MLRLAAAAVLAVPPLVTPALGPGPRAFPVVGTVWPSGTFGAARPDVPGGWHHGDDLFAPVGTPVVACADGVVFSVGWNRIGGWRLWLVDREGNEFYYAHLSAYAPDAVDGAVVRAGDVLGFVGASGDAAGTPAHLEFEVHPAALRPLGYAGAVDPDPYLRAWRHVTARAAAPEPYAPGRAQAAAEIAAYDISTAAGASLGR